MNIAFPKRTVTHLRKRPKTSIVNQHPFFGVPGKVLSYREAMAVYHKIQDFLDLWDVETEIDYQESIDRYTEEEYVTLRSEMREIAFEYRCRLDDDGHWNDVLVGVMDLLCIKKCNSK